MFKMILALLGFVALMGLLFLGLQGAFDSAAMAAFSVAVVAAMYGSAVWSAFTRGSGPKATAIK